MGVLTLSIIALWGLVFLLISEIDLIWKVVVIVLYAASWIVRVIPGIDPQAQVIAAGALSGLVAVWGIAYWQLP